MGQGLRILLGAAALVIVVAGLKSASSILVPVLASAFLAVISLPPVHWLEKHKLPRWAAVLIVLLGVFFVFTGLSVYVGASIKDFTENLEAYQDSLGGQAGDLIAWLQSMGVEISRDSIEQNLDTGKLVSMFGDAVGAMGSLLSDSLFVMLTVIFILAEAAGLPRKIRLAMGNPDADLGSYSKVLDSIQGYLGVKTWVSLATGILAGVGVAIVGVDYPLLWGLIAFLLNYIPTLGSIIAAAPPTLLALVQHGWRRALIVVVIYVAVNMVMGNVVEPRFMGKKLGLSTLVVFLSMVFWGWVWGPVGMVLCVPLTMLVKIVCEESDELKWVSVLLGSGAEVRSRETMTPPPAHEDSR
jgi:predicted PurR-regulated permease PerM